MYTGTRLTTAIHRRLLSRFFLREGDVCTQASSNIMCEFLRRTHKSQPSTMLVLFIASSLEKRGKKSAKSPGLLRSVKHGPYVTSLKETVTGTDPLSDFSHNEAKENAWGLGWSGITNSMVCGIMRTLWTAIYSIKPV